MDQLKNLRRIKKSSKGEVDYQKAAKLVIKMEVCLVESTPVTSNDTTVLVHVDVVESVPWLDCPITSTKRCRGSYGRGHVFSCSDLECYAPTGPQRTITRTTRGAQKVDPTAPAHAKDEATEHGRQGR